MNRNIVVVIATPEELKLVSKYIPYKTYSIIITGVGYGNVFDALKDVPRDSLIINIGYAGSNCIKVGTACGVHRVNNYHPNVTYNEPWYQCISSEDILETDSESVNCHSSSDFVLQTDIKEPCVFDMELYAIMSMGFKYVKAVKVVSDNLNYKEYEDNFKDFNDKDCDSNSQSIKDEKEYKSNIKG